MGGGGQRQENDECKGNENSVKVMLQIFSRVEYSCRLTKEEFAFVSGDKHKVGPCQMDGYRTDY